MSAAVVFVCMMSMPGRAWVLSFLLARSLVVDVMSCIPTYQVPATVSEGGGEFPRDGFCLSAPAPFTRAPASLPLGRIGSFYCGFPLTGRKALGLLLRVRITQRWFEFGRWLDVLCGKHCIVGIQKLMGNLSTCIEIWADGLRDSMPRFVRPRLPNTMLENYVPRTSYQTLCDVG